MSHTRDGKRAEATRSSPCKVCNQGTKGCSVEDGLFRCRGASGQVSGFVALGKSKDGAWSFYRDEAKQQLNGKGTHNPRPSLVDWEKSARQCGKKLTPQLRAALALHLGLPLVALDALGLIGWMAKGPHTDRDTYKPLGGCWTFPELDAAGKVTAIVCRYPNAPAGAKNKLTMQGGRRGLTVPERWDQGLGPVLVPEGASDTLALAFAGLCAVGRPSAQAGDKLLAALFGSQPATRDLVILGENDAKSDGTWPGRDGAMKVAGDLQRLLPNRRVQWALPPDGAKDARAWFLARGLGDDANAWQDAGRCFAKALRPQEIEPASPQPAIISAAALVGLKLPEPRWAVQGLVPEGLTVLAGKPKLGKSWLALLLGLAIAGGGVALGTIGAEKGRVLYLALEDTRRRLQRRITTILKKSNAQAPDFLEMAVEWGRQDAGGLEALDQWLGDHPDARLVVIDTWPKYRPGYKGKNEYQEDYVHAASLKTLADKHGVAILVVHHCRKMEADDPFDTVSGTLGLTGAADAVLVLRRERSRADAALYVTGRDLEEQELALNWDKEYCLWTIVGGAEEFRLTRERAAVVEVLQKAREPLTPTAVALLLGKSVNAAKLLLWKMAEANQVERKEGGKYTVSASGNRGNPETEASNRVAGGPNGRVSTVSTVSAPEHDADSEVL